MRPCGSLSWPTCGRRRRGGRVHLFLLDLLGQVSEVERDGGRRFVHRAHRGGLAAAAVHSAALDKNMLSHEAAHKNRQRKARPPSSEARAPGATARRARRSGPAARSRGAESVIPKHPDITATRRRGESQHGAHDGGCNWATAGRHNSVGERSGALAHRRTNDAFATLSPIDWSARCRRRARLDRPLRRAQLHPSAPRAIRPPSRRRASRRRAPPARRGRRRASRRRAPPARRGRRRARLAPHGVGHGDFFAYLVKLGAPPSSPGLRAATEPAAAAAGARAVWRRHVPRQLPRLVAALVATALAAARRVPLPAPLAYGRLTTAAALAQSKARLSSSGGTASHPTQARAARGGPALFDERVGEWSRRWRAAGWAGDEAHTLAVLQQALERSTLERRAAVVLQQHARGRKARAGMRARAPSLSSRCGGAGAPRCHLGGALSLNYG